MRFTCYRIAFCVAALLPAAGLLYGQLLLSTIRGNLVDPTGSAVAGAKITVTDIHTNVNVRGGFRRRG